MMSPSGSEQALSLAWALENVADFGPTDAVEAVCAVVGISVGQWEACVEDRTWFVGDPRWQSREQIEFAWNERFARLTNVWLDEDAWHTPLWHLWLTDSRMVFAANLSFLIKLGGRGTVTRLAEFTKRDRTTVSKWGRWKEEGRSVRLPPATVVPRLLEFFDLKPSFDLYQEPLFLGRAEIHDALLRVQGKYYLGCLSGEHLSQAVGQLREESVRQTTKRLGGVDE